MKIINIKTILGPNVFHHRPVLIMTVELEDFTEVASSDIEGFNERLLAYLPGLQAHHCSPGHPGGFVERLKRGTYMGHIIEHIALELSTLAGSEVNYGKTVNAGKEGLYNVAVRFHNEEGMKFLLKTAVELAELAAKREFLDYPVAQKIEEAKQIILDTQLGPSTQAIVNAAEKRGIPWLRLNEMNLIQFGYGKHRRLIQATTTSTTSDIAVDIAQDKNLTKKLLQSANLRVPRGLVAKNEVETLQVFEELGAPVALKPVDGHHGQGVCLNLGTASEVSAAYQIAAKYSPVVLLEEFLCGRDYRVLVINGKMVAASERIPAHVYGDGKHTLRELVEIENSNPLRGEGHEKPMTKIRLDAETWNYLAKSSLSLKAVPKFGEMIFLKQTANLSTGGMAIDVTDLVHPEIRVLCERAARFVGLDICGVDLIAKDISQPVSRDVGIVEVNAGPGIRMHVHPSHGKSRDVGAAIVDMMYPDHCDGRIPIVAITGTNGKTTVTRMVSFVLGKSGAKVGMTTTDGIFVNGVKVASGDTTGPISARTILSDSDVEVAVLETARGGLVKRGLGFDWCDVGVITNVREDHIGQDGIESVDDILHIKSLVAERVREGGTLVFNAEDENLLRLAKKLENGKIKRKLVYFALDACNSVLRRHITSGGDAYFAESGWIMEAQGGKERRLIHTSEIPLTLFGTAQFQVANVLAAIASCVAQKVPYDVILLALRQFRSNEHNAGRANLYKVGRGYAMLDYGHNPDAFKAICQMTSSWTTKCTIGVIGVPGDRSNQIILNSAFAAAQGFDRIYLRDDLDLRGRRPGEAPRLFSDAVARLAPNMDCTVILDEFEAMRVALKSVNEGEIVVIFYDELTAALKILNEMGAQPLDSFESLKLYSSEIRPLDRKASLPPQTAPPLRRNGQIEIAR